MSALKLVCSAGNGAEPASSRDRERERERESFDDCDAGVPVLNLAPNKRGVRPALWGRSEGESCRLSGEVVSWNVLVVLRLVLLQGHAILRKHPGKDSLLLGRGVVVGDRGLLPVPQRKAISSRRQVLQLMVRPMGRHGRHARQANACLGRGQFSNCLQSLLGVTSWCIP